MPPPLLLGVGVDEVEATDVEAEGVGEGVEWCTPLPFSLSGTDGGVLVDDPARESQVKFSKLDHKCKQLRTSEPPGRGEAR